MGLRVPCFSRVRSPKWPHRPPLLAALCCYSPPLRKHISLGPFSSSPYPVQILGPWLFCLRGAGDPSPSVLFRGAVPGERACTCPCCMHTSSATAPLLTLALLLLCWPWPWLTCPLLRKAPVAGVSHPVYSLCNIFLHPVIILILFFAPPTNLSPMRERAECTLSPAILQHLVCCLMHKKYSETL